MMNKSFHIYIRHKIFRIFCLSKSMRVTSLSFTVVEYSINSIERHHLIFWERFCHCWIQLELLIFRTEIIKVPILSNHLLKLMYKIIWKAELITCWTEAPSFEFWAQFSAWQILGIHSVLLKIPRMDQTHSIWTRAK